MSMEFFTEEILSAFSVRQWLIKTDNKTATPYLFKFLLLPEELKCALLATDTKSVWGEALNANQISARWQACNPDSEPDFLDSSHRDSWTSSTLQLLNNAHSPGGFLEASIEVQEESRYSNRAFSISYDSFIWRWETSDLGHKLGSELLSKQLILPLIGLNHLAFTATTIPNQLSETELQTNIDRVARTAKRALDTHVKNALSKPQVSSGMSRLTGFLHSQTELPPITMTLEAPSLEVPEVPVARHADSVPASGFKPQLAEKSESVPPVFQREPSKQASPTRQSSVAEAEVDPDATDEDSDDGSPPYQPAPVKRNTKTSMKERSPTPMSEGDNEAHKQTSVQQSEDETPLPAKTKLVKRVRTDSESDNDNGGEKRRPVERVKTGTGAKRGTRQPLKRGGKRF